MKSLCPQPEAEATNPGCQEPDETGCSGESLGTWSHTCAPGHLLPSACLSPISFALRGPPGKAELWAQNVPDWEESALLAECASVGRAAVAINVYGLLSDHSSHTGLAGALCHLGLFGIPATHHFVVLPGAIPPASCFLDMSTLGVQVWHPPS